MESKFFKILEVITPYLIYFLLLALLFDGGVTFYNYKTDYNYFINSEGNESLVAELKAGIPFFKTVTIWFPFIAYLFLVYYFQYIKRLKFKPKHQVIKGALLTIVFFTVYIQITRHIIGGISWLI